MRDRPLQDPPRRRGRGDGGGVGAVGRLARLAGRPDGRLRKDGLAKVEGFRALEAALEAGAEVVGIVAAPAAAARARRLAAGRAEVEVVRSASKGLFETETPQGVVALARRPRRTMEEVLAGRPPLVVVLDSVRDPGNVGAIVRTAAAAGALGAVVLRGSADPWGAKAVRAAVGAAWSLPLAADVAPAEADRALRAAGYSVAVADPRGETDHRAWRPAGPRAVVLGGEAAGPAHAWPGAARVRIPIAPGAESLNVAAAAAVLLFELAPPGCGGRGDSVRSPAH